MNALARALIFNYGGPLLELLARSHRRRYGGHVFLLCPQNPQDRNSTQIELIIINHGVTVISMFSYLIGTSQSLER